jgi:hypothetical protein
MIDFWSHLTLEQIARVLAACVYSDAPMEEGVPFLSTEGPWWELSRQNDHKIDDRGRVDSEGRHLYTFRDRYRNENRMRRVVVVLQTIGAQRIDAP